MGRTGACYEIHEGCLRLRVTGARPAQAITDALRQAAVDPRLEMPVKSLVDARAAGLTLSARDVQSIANATGSIGAAAGARVAVVVASDLMFGITRMLATMSETFGIEIRAFREMERAGQWLRGDPTAA